MLTFIILQGWYACAALNEAGSVVKKIYVRVITSDESEQVQQQPEIPVNRWGSEQTIVINSIVPASSSSLDIFWDMTEGVPSTTLSLHYRSIGAKSFELITFPMESKEVTLNDLKPYTEYEVFITVSNGLSGSVSNIRIGKTMDGAPSAPPSDVRVGVINTTAAYVRWSPPPTHLLNGELTGYKASLK